MKDFEKHYDFQEIPIQQGYRHIKVDGLWCKALDIGCPDFEAAEQNRLRQHATNQWWEDMEHLRDETKQGGKLPAAVPVNWQGPPKTYEEGKNGS